MRRETCNENVSNLYPDGSPMVEKRRNPLCELFHGFTFHKHDGARSKGGSSTIEKGGGGRVMQARGLKEGQR